MQLLIQTEHCVVLEAKVTGKLTRLVILVFGNLSHD